jgi:hypothetical protein
VTADRYTPVAVASFLVALFLLGYLTGSAHEAARRSKVTQSNLVREIKDNNEYHERINDRISRQFDQDAVKACQSLGPDYDYWPERKRCVRLVP